MKKNHVLNYSITHSLTQLIWYPGNRSFHFGTFVSYKHQNDAQMATFTVETSHTNQTSPKNDSTASKLYPKYKYVEAVLLKIYCAIFGSSTADICECDSDAVALLAGQWTWNSQVAGSRLGWVPLCSGLGWATYTCVTKQYNFQFPASWVKWPTVCSSMLTLWIPENCLPFGFALELCPQLLITNHGYASMNWDVLCFGKKSTKYPDQAGL